MDVDFICDPNAMCVNDIMDVAKVNFFNVLGSDSLTNQINVFSSISLERWKLTHAFAVQEPLSSIIWSTRTIRNGRSFLRKVPVLSSETRKKDTTLSQWMMLWDMHHVQISMNVMME